MDAPQLKSPRKVLFRRPDSVRYYLLFRKLKNYTMVEYDAQMQMRDLILDVDRRGIEGDIVETGCWKGGTAAFMAYVSKHNGSNRMTWMFDSFEGFPSLKENDAIGSPSPHVFTEGYLATPVQDAHKITRILGVEQNTRIVKGWFKDTLPKAAIGKIAILRMDADFYEATMETLEALYDKVAKGGYVVIDDFQYEGCRRALYDFFSKRGIGPLLMKRNQHERVYFKK
jgi:hypothetical protein